MTAAGAVHPFGVGALRCLAIDDGTYTYTAEQYFANAAPEELAPALEAHGLDPKRIPSPYTCLLVDTGRERVLVDTGGGDFDPGVGRLPGALASAGVDPASVDVVIITHAHPDHIGALCLEPGTPRFPNARHVIARAEWEHWTSPALLSGLLPVFARPVREHLLPLADRIELIDAGEIVGGTHALPAPGHTPGHLALVIASEGDELLYISDAALHPLHLERPDWYLVWDIDRRQALESRRLVFDRAADNGSLVLAFHFDPFPGLGRVTRAGAGWQWTAEPSVGGG